MPIRVTVELTGLREVANQIAGLGERLANLRPAFEIIADLLEAHVAQQFATQGARAGQPWAPLAPRTVLMRLRRWGYYGRVAPSNAGPTGPILRWGGRLQASFARGSGEHIRDITDDGLAWGTRVPYAGFHQSALPRTRLPRRAMVAFRDAFQQRELVFQPLRLWLQGVPAGGIRSVMTARLGLGALGARLS